MAVISDQSNKRSDGSGAAAKPGQSMNPFTKASYQAVESVLPLTGALDGKRFAPTDIPTGYYLRKLVLDIEVSGVADAVWEADGIPAALEQVALKDPSGTEMLSLSGYELYLANLYGGISQHPNPADVPSYGAPGLTGGRMSLVAPFEIISRGAYGAVPNFNADQPVRLEVARALQADVLASAGSVTLDITSHIEGWVDPPATDANGVPNQTRPESMGVIQNWTSTQGAIPGAGQFRLRLPRVGNTIRNLIFVARTAAGVRSDALWPTELSVYLGGRYRYRVSPDYLYDRMTRLYGPDITRPTGVLVFPFTDDFDDTPGAELGDLYVPTSPSSRFELSGVWGAGGTVNVITNDIISSAQTAGPGETIGA